MLATSFITGIAIPFLASGQAPLTPENDTYCPPNIPDNLNPAFYPRFAWGPGVVLGPSGAPRW